MGTVEDRVRGAPYFVLTESASGGFRTDEDAVAWAVKRIREEMMTDLTSHAMVVVKAVRLVKLSQEDFEIPVEDILL